MIVAEEIDDAGCRVDDLNKQTHLETNGQPPRTYILNLLRPVFVSVGLSVYQEVAKGAQDQPGGGIAAEGVLLSMHVFP